MLLPTNPGVEIVLLLLCMFVFSVLCCCWLGDIWPAKSVLLKSQLLFLADLVEPIVTPDN